MKTVKSAFFRLQNYKKRKTINVFGGLFFQLSIFWFAITMANDQ